MYRKLISGMFFILLRIQSGAQAPEFVPYGEPEPLELTLTNIIVFIVIPVLIIFGYFLYRRKRNDNRKKNS